MRVEEEHGKLELKMLAKVTFVMIGPRIIDFDSKPIESLNFDFETKVSSKDSQIIVNNVRAILLSPSIVVQSFRNLFKVISYCYLRFECNCLPSLKRFLDLHSLVRVV